MVFEYAAPSARTFFPSITHTIPQYSQIGN